MNLKNQLINMDKKLVDMQYIDDTYVDGIENLFLTIETENVSYSPCCYLDEDEEWIKILVLSSENSSHCSAVRKDSIISFGFINSGSETITAQKELPEPSDIYQ